MGAHYFFVNRTKREVVNPNRMRGLGVKYEPTVYGRPANVLAWLMLNRWWRDDVIVIADSGEHWLTVEISKVETGKFQDVTREVVEAWNEECGPDERIEMESPDPP